MMKYKIDEIKQDQRMRKQYGERRQLAEAELQKKLGSAPRLSEVDRASVKKHMASIQKHNDFTFAFQGELKERGLDYSSMNVHGSAHFEHANREAMNLKKEIRRILNPYLVFWHEEPDPTTLVFYNSKKHRYHNPDKEVVKLLEQVEALRNYGEEEVFQLKKIGVNFAHMLGVRESELNE
ncbi:hypothetical protein [Planococcus dechangensis]|uniref:Uncharacterized protein n=1 Tax=Planococcus dechangensis TaxID=1176255 RepID=A0ABV9MDY7_9BACL